MDALKTHVYAVCITGKSGSRKKMLATAIESFRSQDYPGMKRLVVFTDRDDVVLKKYADPEILQVRIAKKRYMLGELRNAARTYVCQQIPRDKKAFYTVHWDEDDYRPPDYLSSVVEQMNPGTVSMLESCIHADLLTGSAFVYSNPQGVRSSLFYSPYAPLAFSRVRSGESDDFVRALVHPPVTRKAFALPKLEVMPNDSRLMIRFYDGQNVESRVKFMHDCQNCRQLTNAEVEYLKSVMLKYK